MSSYSLAFVASRHRPMDDLFREVEAWERSIGETALVRNGERIRLICKVHSLVLIEIEVDLADNAAEYDRRFELIRKFDGEIVKWNIDDQVRHLTCGQYGSIQLEFAFRRRNERG